MLKRNITTRMVSAPTNVATMAMAMLALGALGCAAGNNSDPTTSDSSAVKAASPACASARDACRSSIEALLAPVQTACAPVETACDRIDVRQRVLIANQESLNDTKELLA